MKHYHPFSLTPFSKIFQSNPQKSPQKNTKTIELVLTNHKPSLKVPCHEIRAFKEWKFIVQVVCVVEIIKDKHFEWLTLVFGLPKAQIKCRDQVLCLRINFLTNFTTNFSRSGE